MPRQCAVIGASVEGSLSPFIHRCFAAQQGLALEYRAISVAQPFFERAVQDFFDQGGFGLNVTIPFKERAYAMAEVKTLRAERAKAANILFYKNGLLLADNSDGDAFWSDLSERVTKPLRRILLLGAGGAARGIISAVSRFPDVELFLWNRNIARAHALQTDFPFITLWDKANTWPMDVVVNTLPPQGDVGIYEQCCQALQAKTLAYDLSYYPKRTPFLHFAAPFCERQTNGLSMLVLQAADTLRQWIPGANPDVRTVLEILLRVSSY